MIRKYISIVTAQFKRDFTIYTIGEECGLETQPFSVFYDPRILLI